MKKTIILLCIIQSCIGCSGISKFFNKQKTQLDSTATIRENSDSTVNTDSSTFHKEENQSWWKYDTATKKDNSVITEDIVQEKFDTTGKLTEKITTHRKKENNKQSESSSLTGFNNHSQIDSSELKKQAQKTEEKSSDTHVTKKEKEVTKEVKKTKIWWWLLLLIPIIIYRKPIWNWLKAVFVHLMTGL